MPYTCMHEYATDRTKKNYCPNTTIIGLITRSAESTARPILVPIESSYATSY